MPSRVLSLIESRSCKDIVCKITLFLSPVDIYGPPAGAPNAHDKPIAQYDIKRFQGRYWRGRENDWPFVEQALVTTGSLTLLNFLVFEKWKGNVTRAGSLDFSALIQNHCYAIVFWLVNHLGITKPTLNHELLGWATAHCILPPLTVVLLWDAIAATENVTFARKMKKLVPWFNYHASMPTSALKCTSKPMVQFFLEDDQRFAKREQISAWLSYLRYPSSIIENRQSHAIVVFQYLFSQMSDYELTELMTDWGFDGLIKDKWGPKGLNPKFTAELKSCLLEAYRNQMQKSGAY